MHTGETGENRVTYHTTIPVFASFLCRARYNKYSGNVNTLVVSPTEQQ